MPKFVGWFTIDGWREPRPFYQIRCEICKKLVVNNPMGHMNEIRCPLCSERELQIERADKRGNSVPSGTDSGNNSGDAVSFGSTSHDGP